MSKVVKKIGRAVGKVVKGAVNVVKKVAKSPIGKMLMVAAATYFGVPMIAGALGGAAGATGFAGTISGALSGAGSGLAQAWGGLTGAFSAGSIGGAMDSLAGGFSPSAAYGGGQAGVLSQWAPATGAGTQVASAGGLPPGAVPGAQGWEDEMYSAANGAMKPPASSGGGILDTMFKSPYTAPALIQAGSSVLGAIGQGKMAEEAIKQREASELRLREEERRNRNNNMGVLFASKADPGPGYYQRSSFVDRFQG